MAKNTNICLIKKPIKIFFYFLNINKTEMGKKVNPHSRPICYIGQVKPVH